MTNTTKSIRALSLLALIPALAIAQANPPAKAPTKAQADSAAKAKAAAKAPTAATKVPAKSAAKAPAKAAEPHDMSKMNAAPGPTKQGMGGMKMDASKQAKMDEMMKDPAMKAKMGAMMKDTAAMQQKMAGMQHDMAAMPGMAGMPKEEMSGWKQLDGFHALLQLTWHPIANGDFKPAREHGAHLVEAAFAWRSSKGPSSCDNATLRNGMPDLIAEVRSFGDAVKRGASDDAIQVTLKRTHDAFEAIAEPCMMAGMKGMKMDAPKKP